MFSCHGHNAHMRIFSHCDVNHLSLGRQNIKLVNRTPHQPLFLYFISSTFHCCLHVKSSPDKSENNERLSHIPITFRNITLLFYGQTKWLLLAARTVGWKSEITKRSLRCQLWVTHVWYIDCCDNSVMHGQQNRHVPCPNPILAIIPQVLGSFLIHQTFKWTMFKLL